MLYSFARHVIQRFKELNHGSLTEPELKAFELERGVTVDFQCAHGVVASHFQHLPAMLGPCVCAGGVCVCVFVLSELGQVQNALLLFRHFQQVKDGELELDVTLGELRPSSRDPIAILIVLDLTQCTVRFSLTTVSLLSTSKTTGIATSNRGIATSNKGITTSS